MAILPEELPAVTTAQLAKLNSAIIDRNVEEFEEALDALQKQGQISAISDYTDANDRTPLINAVRLDLNDEFGNSVKKDYYQLMQLPTQLPSGEFGTYKDIPFRDHLIFKLLQINDQPYPNHEIEMQFRLYFTWRLLSFSDISPNVTIDTDDYDELTPLHLSINKGDESIFSLLMARDDINVDLVDPDDNIAPIHLAADYQRNNMLLSLIKKGANLNVRTTNESDFGANVTALSLALTNWYPETARILLEYGAGIGADLKNSGNFANLVLNGCNVNGAALFFATFDNGVSLGDNGFADMFTQAAITPPWEEKVRLNEHDEVEQYKPTYPQLKHYKHLQKRCIELIALYPDRDEFRKLATYFGAYIPKTSVTIQELNDEGVLEEKNVKVHGTLQSLIALKLTTLNEQERITTINHFIETRKKIAENKVSKKKSKRKAEKKIELTVAGELCHINEVYAHITDEYNMDNTQDFDYLKHILTSFEQQLHNMQNSQYFHTFDNYYVRDTRRIGLYMLVFDGIIGGALMLITFIIIFSVVAATVMPILPALAFAAFFTAISFGIGTLTVALTAASVILIPLIVDSIKHAHFSVQMLKSLRELAELVSIIPALMSDDIRQLFGEMLENGISKTSLRAFIDAFRAKITEQLNQNNLGVKDDEIPALVQDANNWKFYPPARNRNVQIEEQLENEKEQRDLGLFRDLI